MLLQGTYDHQLWLDVGWIVFYRLGAPRRCTRRCRSSPTRRVPSEVPPCLRLGAAGASTLIAPTVLILDDAEGRSTTSVQPLVARLDPAVLDPLCGWRSAATAGQVPRAERCCAAGAALVSPATGWSRGRSAEVAAHRAASRMPRGSRSTGRPSPRPGADQPVRVTDVARPGPWPGDRRSRSPNRSALPPGRPAAQCGALRRAAEPTLAGPAGRRQVAPGRARARPSGTPGTSPP